jgi:hypothetical protein
LQIRGQPAAAVELFYSALSRSRLDVFLKPGAARPGAVARYESRHQYVKRVHLAADRLAAKRYLTGEDRKVLIAAALGEPLPCPREDDDGSDLTPVNCASVP